MAYLIVKSTPEIAFYSGNDYPDIDVSYNSLLSFSRIDKQLRIDSGRNGTITIKIKPMEFPTNILRKPAEFYINGSLIFKGIISSVYTGVETSITIQESAGRLKYTDTLPLRSTADLGVYVVSKSLPVIYGNAEISPFDYNGSGYLWFICDHPIQSIEKVTVNGSEISAYILRQEYEGAAVSVLETQEQYDSSDSIVVYLNGKVHPVTGALLDTVEVVLWDFLANVCGLDVQQSDFDRLRSECPYKIGGIIDDARSTIQTTLNSICGGSGLAWAPSIQSIGIPWPQTDPQDSMVSVNPSNIDQVSFEENSNGIITKLRVLYDRNDAFREHNGALELIAKTAYDEYGSIGKTLELSWIRSRRDAIEIGKRHIEYYSRHPWTFRCRTNLHDYDLASKLNISYPYFPLDWAIIKEVTSNESLTNVVCEARSGPIDTIVKSYDNNRVDSAYAEGPYYEYRDGLASILITGDDEAPLPGARVTIDGDTVKIADQAGWIVFEAESGEYELLVQYPGMNDQSIRVYIQ